MKTLNDYQKNQSEIINLFMVSRFAGLDRMYKQATEDAEKEHAMELYLGWQEWHQLDDDSQSFIRNYLEK